MGTYDFLIDTYESERLKTLNLWSLFRDGDLNERVEPRDLRGRSVHEQMVHQCVGENLWFLKMFEIDVEAPPLPEVETRLGFIRRYAEDSGRRVEALRGRDDAWWEVETAFFDVVHSRAWIMTRRIAHTSHHRGQLTALLRRLGRELHSTYGPTADTGGLPLHGAVTVYAYESIAALLAGEASGGAKSDLPGRGAEPPTERPGAESSSG